MLVAYTYACAEPLCSIDLPSTKSVKDHTVPLTLPSPGTSVAGMYADSIDRQMACVMAMCTPTKTAPSIIPAQARSIRDFAQYMHTAYCSISHVSQNIAFLCAVAVDAFYTCDISAVLVNHQFCQLEHSILTCCRLCLVHHRPVVPQQSCSCCNAITGAFTDCRLPTAAAA